MPKWPIVAVAVLTLGSLSLFAQEAPSTPTTESKPTPTIPAAEPVLANPEAKPKIDRGVELYNEYLDASVDIVTTAETEIGKKSWSGAGCFIDKEKYKHIITLKENEALAITVSHVVKEEKDKLVRGFGFSAIKILSYKYEVTLKSKKRKYTAELVGWNLWNDTAIIKVKDIDKTDFKAAKIGDSDSLRVGQKIYVIGSPYGVSNTITDGIVSQLHQHVNHFYVEDWIQITAPINPGNSGGVLINNAGEIMGIISVGIRGADGMGYAVPINLANIPQLLKGEVKKGVFGAEAMIDNFSRMGSAEKPKMQDLNELYDTTGIDDPTALDTIFKIADTKYAIVIQVKKDKPADKNGIQKGDIVIKVAGKDIENGMDLRIALINHFNSQANKPVEIDLLRVDGTNIQPIKIFVTLEEEKKDENEDD